MPENELITLLKKEMVPALGVTEPAAIALACATAYAQIKGDPERMNLKLDPGTFKNAYSCAVPGTNKSGIEIAALLGILGGNHKLQLEVLRDITAEQIKLATELKDKDIVKVNIANANSDLYIEAFVETSKGSARVIIQDNHTNITHIEKNESIIFEAKIEKAASKPVFNISNLKLADILEFIEKVPFSQIEFLLDAITVNEKLMEVGTKGAGASIGLGLDHLVKDSKLGDDLRSYAEILTAYAVDARMGGLATPAMSICGSGDHGIIATMPLLAAANKKELKNEQLARGLALSFLITIYIKGFSGRLSAFCGCAVAAGTGAAAGVTYLLGGNIKQIEDTISNMAANLTGIICDGGNFGCSLKAVNGAGAAILSSLLALEGISIAESTGIIGASIENTMQNMGRIASPGMLKTNETILEIMLNKLNN